jgi:hypothetical protein
MQTTSGNAMPFEPAVAIFDACVLYPFHLRNIVVQAAVDRLVEARWTDAIHDEWIRSLVASAPSIPMERLQVTRRLMDKALPAAMVRGYEHRVSAVDLPDPSDRHVVAAAIVAGASIILTWNVRDFPSKALRKVGLRRETPNTFLSAIYDAVPDLMIGSLANARRNLTRSSPSPSDFIKIPRDLKLSGLANRVEKRLAEI